MASAVADAVSTSPLVLIIDDDVDTREVYGVVLNESGMRTTAASHAQEGLSVARALRPDAILTDIVMPGPLDAFSMARLLRADPGTRHIPVVAVSGHEAATIHAACRFQRVLTKPIMPDELVTVMRSVLAHAAAAAERAARLHLRPPPAPVRSNVLQFLLGKTPFRRSR